MFGTYKFPFHYNKTEGGEGTIGLEVSENTKKIWREQRKGDGNPMKGRHHTKQQKEKWSKDRKGKMVGKDHPMYGIHRYGKDAPMYGKTHTEESKQKNRESHLGKRTGANNPKSRPVVQLSMNNEFIRSYNCIKEVTQYGFSSFSVRNCCGGHQDFHMGYKWVYQENYKEVV